MIENYPEEYIRGFVTFFGRDFFVTPDVLIPRLETESLVRRARQVLRGSRHQDSDITGTNTGTIPVKQSEYFGGSNSNGDMGTEPCGCFGSPPSKGGREVTSYYQHSPRAIPYNPSLISLAKKQRKSGNSIENKFWYDILKCDIFLNYRFTRQKPLLDFIVDFYCAELQLVIEIYGESHIDTLGYDHMRTSKLEAYGLHIIRFSNQDVMLRTEGVIETLKRKCEEVSHIQHTPFPPFEGGLETEDNEIGKKIIVVDIGCGSGIIGTSLADLADEVIFLDISPAALEIAEKNFRTHFPEKKAEFIVSDLLSNIPTFQHSNILFVTNLPYIRDEDWIHMSTDTIHEPKLALFGGEKTGFELYERLFEQLSVPSRSYLLSAICLFEFGFDQREIAESIVKKYPEWKYSFFADYAGVERFGEIRLFVPS